MVLLRRFSRSVALRLRRSFLLLHRLRLREFPCAVQDFRARAIEPHGVVPALPDRQTIRNLAVAAAELDWDRAVVALPGREVIERIGVVGVLLEVTFGVVNAD